MKNTTSILLLFLTFFFVNVGNADAQQKHEYVDLGLHSGTLWATCNVGAANPWEYGDYFAWGETTTKSTYSWRDYKYANGASDKLTKYCYKSYYGNNGYTDSHTTLEKSDDVAYQQWGGDWCIPTSNQFNELLVQCSWTWTTLNGKKGYNVKGPNGKSIFLPAAAWTDSDGKALYVGEYGVYWSAYLSTDNPNKARSLLFNSDYDVRAASNDDRPHGNSVRPVRCKN